MRSLRLGLLGLVHVLADGYAFCIPPLLPLLAVRFRLSPTTSALAVVLMTVGHSVLQPVFGLLADRRPGWWLTAGGLVVAGGGVAAVGLAGNYLLVLGLVFVAGLGIGAAHPAPVTAAGRLMPSRRGLAVALFLFAGTLGLAAGPISATLLVDAGGLPAMGWLAAPALLVALLVLLLLPRSLSRPPETAHRPDSLAGEIRHVFALLAQRRRVLWPLWLMAAVRNLAVIGIVIVLPWRLQGEGARTLVRGVGLPMAVFLFSTGVGGVLYCWLRQSREHVVRDTGRLLVAVVPLILLFGALRLPGIRGSVLTDPRLRELCELALLAVCGLLLAGTVPAVTELFQHLVPERPNLAATLSMGSAWGVGGLIGPLLCSGVVQAFGPEYGAAAAFVLIAAIAAAGALLARWAGGSGRWGA